MTRAARDGCILSACQFFESHPRTRVSRLLDSRVRGNDGLGVFKCGQYSILATAIARLLPQPKGCHCEERSLRRSNLCHAQEIASQTALAMTPPKILAINANVAE